MVNDEVATVRTMLDAMTQERDELKINLDYTRRQLLKAESEAATLRRLVLEFFSKTLEKQAGE